MPLKESKLKTYLLVGGLIYVLLFYFSLHMGHAVYLDEAATKETEIYSSIQFGTYSNATSAPVVKESINWFNHAIRVHFLVRNALLRCFCTTTFSFFNFG